jgi:hypothetical protein
VRIRCHEKYNMKIIAHLLLLMALAGCQTMAPKHKVHHTLLDQAAPAGKVIVLPLDIEVKELTAAGLQEEVPAWSDQALANFRSQLILHQDELLPGLQLQFLDEIPAEEQAVLEEYVALNYQVMGSALLFTQQGGDAWQHKAKHFDYSMGPGLSWLAERTGADKALIMIGEDLHSSGGRKAAFIIAAAFGATIPLGHSLAVVGLVDLRSGDLLWMHHYVTGDATDFRDADDVAKVLTDLFTPYPGIDEYRQFVQGN